jgi:hypothetical protein
MTAAIKQCDAVGDVLGAIARLLSDAKQESHSL